jgi:hypothetical protein
MMVTGANAFEGHLEEAVGKDAACVATLGQGQSCAEQGTAGSGGKAGTGATGPGAGGAPAGGRKLMAVDSNTKSLDPGGSGAEPRVQEFSGPSLSASAQPASPSPVSLTDLQRLATMYSYPAEKIGSDDPARQQGKTEAVGLMTQAHVPTELQAIFQAELMIEQDIPSMRAEGGPGRPTGRDASKDPKLHGGRWQYLYNGQWKDADGSMNVGPWNDNIAMLSQYGGMPLPMQDGSTAHWGDPGFDPQKVDWTKLESDFGPTVTDAKLVELLGYKQQMLQTLGTDVYMAARRAGTSVIVKNPAGGYSIKQPVASDVQQWISGQSHLATEFIADPAKMTDGKRYRIDYPWI